MTSILINVFFPGAKSGRSVGPHESTQANRKKRSFKKTPVYYVRLGRLVRELESLLFVLKYGTYKTVKARFWPWISG